MSKIDQNIHTKNEKYKKSGENQTNAPSSFMFIPF